MRIALHGGSSLMELRRVAEDRVRLDLESLEGVAAVRVEGGLEEEIQVELETRRLASLGIPISVVTQRLAAENVNLTGGLLKDGEAEFLVRTLNELTGPADIEQVVIARIEGAPVEAGRRGAGRARPPGARRGDPHRRPRGRGDRRLQGGRRQHGERLGGGARAPRGVPVPLRRPPRRRRGGDRRRPGAVHLPVGGRGPEDGRHRRPAGDRHPLPLPAPPQEHGHHQPVDPDLGGGHLLPHVRHRREPQHHVPRRPGPGGGHAGGQLHRRPRERAALPRAGPFPPRGGAPRRRRGRLGGDRRHPDDDLRLRAHRLRRGRGRTAVPRPGADRDLLAGGLPPRGADADPHARLPRPASAHGRGRGPRRRGGGSAARRPCCGPSGRCCGVWGVGWRRCSLAAVLALRPRLRRRRRGLPPGPRLVPGPPAPSRWRPSPPCRRACSSRPAPSASS